MTMLADGLPDPDRHAAFYADVPTKRLVAWIADVIAIGLLSLILLPLTLFTALFYFPLFYMVIGVAYRTIGLARKSATPGMRLMSIEIREGGGERLDFGTAVLHVLGYTVSVAVFPLQLISIVMMLATPRAQGLTDHVLGTAAINLAARE